MAASRAVLFDLDGTLADTAPDLAAALNYLRTQKGMKEMALSEIRPYASMGARGLLRIGFGLKPQDADFAVLRDAFLSRYEKKVCVHTRLFDGMPELLAKLRIPWGIVTNKAKRFTGALVKALRLSPACVVCGDSTPHLKPHPAPLLLASKELNIPCSEILYVGDDLRDVQAARAAGMRAVAVEYGYHGVDNGGPETWNADILISQPLELLDHL